MPPLTVAVVPAPGRTVVRLTGEVDLASADAMAAALACAADPRVPLVVVDVAGLRFWDVSGLHVLATFTADLAASRRQCRVVGAPAATRRLVVLAGFAGALQLDGPQLPSVDECADDGEPRALAPAAPPGSPAAGAREHRFRPGVAAFARRRGRTEAVAPHRWR